jgi:MFS family permease
LDLFYKNKFLGKFIVLAITFNQKIDKIMLRLILTFIVISGIFTLDIYLPGVPEQIKSLGVSNAAVNFTFTMFSVAFALSQLIAGPLSDRYGRKPILIVGLSLAILATFLCGFIQSYWQLLLLRIIQAIGASCLVVANAIVRDLHDGLAATRLRGYITMVAGVTISIAPAVGSVLVYFSGWRGTFILSSGVFLATLMFVIFFFKETANPHKINIKEIVKNYYHLIMYNSEYMKRNLQGALGYSVHFCFVVMSSYIIVVQMHYNLFVYSAFMIFYGLALSISGFTTNVLSAKYDNNRIIQIGAVVMLLSSMALLVVLNIFESSNIYLFSMLILVMIFGGTIVKPSSLTLALSSVSKLSGQASAGISLLQFLLSGIVASIIGLFSNMVNLICLYAILAALIILFIS